MTVNITDTAAPSFAAQGGEYEVITMSGREPQFASGNWSDGKVQVQVGKEWEGRIKVTISHSMEASPVKYTDMIGGPFGWAPRHIDFD